MSDFDDLKKLDPIKRAKKLGELIEKRNKEIAQMNKDIEEAKKLSEKTKRETDELLALQERIQVPDSGDTPGAPDLETISEEAHVEKKPDEGPESQRDLYAFNPAMATQEMYSQALGMYTAAKSHGGDITAAMAEQMHALHRAVEQRERYANKGTYQPNDDFKHQADTIKQIADKILSMYKGDGVGKDGVSVWQ